MNNKPSGLHIASVLGLILLLVGLAGCSSPKKTQPAPEVEQAPPLVEEPVEPAQPSRPVVMARDYPDRYTVVKGDTLWDISARFLKDPWLWPEVWHINPEVRNPHLIYPGDVLVLYFVNGKPVITLDGQGGIVPPPAVDNTGAKVDTTVTVIPKVPVPKLPVEKRGPKIRVSSLDRAIDTIPAGIIEPFLTKTRVVTDDELDDAPYIVAAYEGRIYGSAGNRIYANDIENKDIGMYNVVRRGKEYRDPDSGRVLGYEATYLGDAHLVEHGDPSTLTVSKSAREIVANDLLLPADNSPLLYQYMPRSPSKPVRGVIMDVLDGVSNIGQYQIVAINRGDRDGLEAGHVLTIYQRGAEVPDPRSFLGFDIDLPDERAGIMLVFRVYQRMSFALVMEAQRPLHVGDYVINPR